MITQFFTTLKLVVGSFNLCYVRSIYKILLAYAACKCSNRVYGFLSGSTASASFFQACHHFPATLSSSKTRGKNQQNAQSLPTQNLPYGIQLPTAAPSPYIIKDGKEDLPFGQDSFIFTIVIDYEPSL